ncbi:MAG: Uma2 family endonuclease [Gemmatimonadetes bacterium]|nr:Uma2 family endonuclease [Gemmatimonadota bacterium]
MTASAFMTADELLRLQLPDKRTELVKGRLIVREPAGYLHGMIAVRLTKVIANHVDAHGLGIVLAAETGFKLQTNPDTVRAPDVAFVSNVRVPATPPRGYAPFAPDLAVEVLSPDDRPGEVLAKVADWLRNGSRLVWVIDPDRRGARVYRDDGTESILNETDALAGEDVLPGFSCQLATIF